LLALVGLAIPLIGSNFAVGLVVSGWLVVLALLWLFGRHVLPPDYGVRAAVAIALLPVLFMLAWWGGWWLIPADLAWLVLVLLARPSTDVQLEQRGRL
jgi:hypothetical protein